MTTIPDTTILEDALAQIRECRFCADLLPLGPRPVLRAGAGARIMLVGQAPGTRVHATGIPWNDRSGDRLRGWLALGRDAFYDTERIAIVPMGFCYPGVDAKGGDLPPRPECAPKWHPVLLPLLPRVELILPIGMYAHRRYLGTARKRTLGETVAAWREYAPRFLPLPHPSWRTAAWERRNPWFGEELLPELRGRVQDLL